LQKKRKNKIKNKVLSLVIIFSMVLCVMGCATNVGGKKESSAKQLKPLKDYIAYSEKQLKQIYNWKDKERLYLDVISSIKNYIISYDDQSSINKIQKKLSSWEDKYLKFSNTTDKLMNDLKSEMEKSAIEIVRVRYPDIAPEELISSNPETIEIENNGIFMYVNMSFGNSHIIYRRKSYPSVSITVRGLINMRNNTMLVLGELIKARDFRNINY